MCVAEMPLRLAVETKNTFVHFQERVTLARRATCSGRLLTVRRASEERGAGGRRSARAVTSPPEACELSFHLAESDSDPEDETVCSSPEYTCWETPTRLLGAAQLVGRVATFGYTSQLCQGCVTPLGSAGCATVVCFEPCDIAGRFECSPCSPISSAATTPRTGALAGWGAPADTSPGHSGNLFPAVWQPLHGERKAKKEGRGKLVPPAKDNELTVMLRNLPPRYSPDALLQEFETFLPSIDFYYLPTNFETRENLGYAFVNFCDKREAARFMEFWAQAGVSESQDAVQEAKVQGFAASVDRFRHSTVLPLLSEELKPRVFRDGVQQPFPLPCA